MKTRRIGAHLSVAGGLIPAAENMISMGGNCLQIFSGSPRGWARKPFDPEKVSAYNAFCKEHDFGPTVIHALYLVNLAADRADLVKNSIDGIIYDLKYSSALNGAGVVVHVGSHLGKGYDAVFEQVIKHIKHILDETPANSMFLIENSAGQEGKLFSKFEDIQRAFLELSSYVKSGRLGWCFDTCHGHAAGYDLKTIDKEMQKYGLLEHLKVIHFNDSRDEFDSGRDRHENIGEGKIGKEEMKIVATNPAFAHVPLVIEVPGFDGNGPDAKNIAIIKGML
jgi:deoxyribonuclease-4